MDSTITSFIFGAVACSLSVGAVIWRIISMKVDSEISTLQHNLEKKDLQISNLQDVQILLQKGLEEKFSHFSSRIKTDNIELEKRLRQVENFLAKGTEFEPRN